MIQSIESRPPLPAIYENLQSKIELASQVIYEIDSPTKIDVVGESQLVLKREDSSQIHSYKWRGAYFKMYNANAAGYDQSFVTASAGNHAQGVALAAARLRLNAVIFMPQTTPKLKQAAVKEFGGDFVLIELVGDCYDEASAAAESYAENHHLEFVRPYDDLDVIAGQATVGLELFNSCPDLEKIFLPIGGGGLASGVAIAAKKILKRNCEIIGVEATNQNSMQLSVKCGRRVAIENVDGFCDGTAVKIPGRLTFEICRDLIDEFQVVDGTEVCSAMRSAWEMARILPEPSGAIALAAALNASGGKPLDTAVVISGSNVDFQTLPRVVRQTNLNKTTRRYFQFTIAEKNGSLIQLLDQFMADLNIVDFQYGKTDLASAHPVVGIEGPIGQLEQLATSKDLIPFNPAEISGSPLSDFRVIPFNPELCENHFFLKVDFPNRPGALRELMRRISDCTNICYFNFSDSGELEGHALIGFERLTSDAENLIFQSIFELGLNCNDRIDRES